jgi:hypothetical protein
MMNRPQSRMMMASKFASLRSVRTRIAERAQERQQGGGVVSTPYVGPSLHKVTDVPPFFRVDAVGAAPVAGPVA